MSNDVIAALDLGSNSAHLLVAEVLPLGHIRRVHTKKTRLRLAEPVVRDGRFGGSLRRKVVETLAELVTQARKKGAGEIAIVATDALRHAEDGARLEEAIENRLAVRVRVLEGLEEAALAYRGMASALRMKDPMLGFDLGGGSLEVAYGENGRFVAGATLPLGSARSSTRFVHDPPWLTERSALHTDAFGQLQAAAKDVLPDGLDGPLPAVGTAGTIRDIGRLGLALAAGTELQRVRGLVVTREQLEAAIAHLVAVPTNERIDLPGISGSRVDILPAGGVVLLAALEAFGLDQIQLCDWGLREGAILDALTDERVVARSDFTPL